MTQLSKQCPTCKHLFETEIFKCKAFPEEIPFEILSGKFKHNKKHIKQSNNVIYEPKG